MARMMDPANCFAMLTRVTYHGAAPPSSNNAQATAADRLHRGRGGSGRVAAAAAAEAAPRKMDRQTECSICLEDFEARQVLRRVGCGHVFHDKVTRADTSIFLVWA
jgi:hypothetical protein